MQDNLFKKSIRIYFRILIWILKVIVSPLILLFHLLPATAWFICTVSYWAQNNEYKYDEYRKDTIDEITGMIKWFKI